MNREVHEINHSDENEAVEHFIDKMNQQKGKRPWLAIFITQKEDGTLSMDRTRQSLPTESFLSALALIAADLVKQTVLKEDPTKIPLSDYLSLQKKLQEKLDKEDDTRERTALLSQPGDCMPERMRDDDPVHGEDNS